MTFPIKISRKKFLSLLAFPVVFIWVRAIRSHQILTPGPTNIVLPHDFPPGYTFYSDLIIYNQQGNLSIFSAKCTHLGCIINHQKNNQVTCPCHGSTFSSKGNPIKGPARTPLKKLDYTYDKTGKNIIVHLA